MTAEELRGLVVARQIETALIHARDLIDNLGKAPSRLTLAAAIGAASQAQAAAAKALLKFEDL